MNDTSYERPLLWIGSSKRDLLSMPSDVVDDFGFGLYQAQIGKYPDIGKTLSGFGGATIIELKCDHKDGTYRAVYTIKFSEVVIVLHAFQKKSKKGRETPRQDIDLIRSRLRLAKEVYKEWKNHRGKNV